MRVFVFVLMMAVAMGGLLGGYRVITGRDLISLSDLGIDGARVNAGNLPTTAPIRAATPAPTAVVLPTRVPDATSTPVPGAPRLMVVGNTDGQGVFLRKTPNLNDKLRAWVDGTKMQVTGNAIESDGVKWLKVTAPDGTDGYIPEHYLVPTP